MRAAVIWERWFVATVLAPALGRGRALRRVAELGEIRDRILTEATIAPTADVLDLGCGTGLLTFPAAEEAGAAIGIDSDPVRLREATQVPAIGAAFAAADARRLPFPDASFDVVLWRGLLAYAPNRGEILAETRRVLRPEGRLCFSESLAGQMEMPSDDDTMGRLWEALREIGAAALGEQAMTRRSLEDLVEAAGFAGVRVQVERRRTTLEDARAVREIFEGAAPGALSLVELWLEAGVPPELPEAFVESLISRTPTLIVTPEGYATATRPRDA